MGINRDKRNRACFYKVLLNDNVECDPKTMYDLETVLKALDGIRKHNVIKLAPKRRLSSFGEIDIPRIGGRFTLPKIGETFAMQKKKKT